MVVFSLDFLHGRFAPDKVSCQQDLIELVYNKHTMATSVRDVTLVKVVHEFRSLSICECLNMVFFIPRVLLQC